MKKTLLGAVAIVSAGVLAAACSGGDGDKTYTLSSGTYQYQIESVPTDTCWPNETTIPPMIALDFAITSTNDTTFFLAGSGVAAGIIPPIPGTKDGNTLTATGSIALEATAGCIVTINASADGTMTANDEFDADLPISLSTVGQSSCGKIAGDSIGGVLPFPVSITTSNGGSCNVTLGGHAVLQ